MVRPITTAAVKPSTDICALLALNPEQPKQDGVVPPDGGSGQLVQTGKRYWRTVQMPDGTYQADIYYYGSGAINYADIRGAGRNNWNLNVERTFRVREKISIDFSAQFTNAFNHTQFRPTITGGAGGPNLTASTLNVGIGQLTNSNFGTFGNETFDPRQTEFQLKIRF